MEKTKKIPLVLIIVVIILLIAVAGMVGYLVSNKKTKENNLTTTNNVVEENNTTNQITEGSNTDEIADIGEVDMQISGVKLDMSYNDVVAKLGKKFTETKQKEEATGNNVIIMKYTDLGIIIRIVDDGSKKVVEEIQLDNSKNTPIARGLSVSSKPEDILKAFKPNSILLNTIESTVVGYPEDDPVYNVNRKSKLIFRKSDSAISTITLTFGNPN